MLAALRKYAEREALIARYELATDVYGVCGCGPFGPTPTFAGADFANPLLTSRNGSQLEPWKRYPASAQRERTIRFQVVLESSNED